MTLVVDGHMHVLPGPDWFPPDLGVGLKRHWWREVRWRGAKTTPEYFAAAAAEMPDPDASKALARMDEAGIDVSVTAPMDHGINFGPVDDEGPTPIAGKGGVSCDLAATTVSPRCDVAAVERGAPVPLHCGQGGRSRKFTIAVRRRQTCPGDLQTSLDLIRAAVISRAAQQLGGEIPEEELALVLGGNAVRVIAIEAPGVELLGNTPNNSTPAGEVVR